MPAAADYLAQVPYVDPKRIYLGGHSTGGTLALLAAESSDKFRAVFSFGPIDRVSGDSSAFLPFDTSSSKEMGLRAPIRWLHAIKCPTFVLEGDLPPSNSSAVESMEGATTNSLVHFYTISGADHFSLLTPVTQVLARKVPADTGSSCNITIRGLEIGAQ